jgi:hypothetical protein
VHGSAAIVEVHRATPGAGVASVFSVLSGPVEIVATGAAVRVDNAQRLRIRDNSVGVVEGLSGGEIELLAANLRGTRQHSTATSEFSEMLTARERDRALGYISARGDSSLGSRPAGSRSDELLAVPLVSEARQRHDTESAPARCTPPTAGARGIVRESDTSTAP